MRLLELDDTHTVNIERIALITKTSEDNETYVFVQGVRTNYNFVIVHKPYAEVLEMIRKCAE